MKTKPVRAENARVGMAVVEIVVSHPSCPPRTLRKRRGRYPTVTELDFEQHGEQGLPIVYVTLSDRPKEEYHLSPADELLILDEDR